MTTYLRGRLTVVWGLLVAVTFLSWWIGARGESNAVDVNLPVTALVAGIAIFKTRLVFWQFMEVRTAPSWLRWNCDGWLAVLVLTLVVLYRYAP